MQLFGVCMKLKVYWCVTETTPHHPTHTVYYGLIVLYCLLCSACLHT